MSMNAFRLLFASLLLWPGVALAQNQWTTSPFEASPTASDSVAEGDDRIRELKLELRERLETEHCFGTQDSDGCSAATGDDSGRHREGSAVVFFENSTPAAIHATDYASDGGASGTALEAGRIWVDSDSDPVNQTYVYDAAFEEIVADPGLESPGPNMLLNGSFEAATTSDTTVAERWTESGAGKTFAFAATAVGEGAGLAFVVTDDVDTNALEGVSQTLDGLDASTTYRLSVRVNPTAGDSCRITTTGGAGPHVSATSAGAGGSYETLTGTFSTDGTPTDIVVNLLNVADGDICTWDHAWVWPEEIQPRRWVSGYGQTTTSSSTASGSTDDIMTESVTIPGPGYQILVMAEVSMNCDGLTNVECEAEVEIDEDSGGGASNCAVASAHVRSQETNNPDFSVSLHCFQANPTPGSTYTYTVDMIERNVDIDLDAEGHRLTVILLRN